MNSRRRVNSNVIAPQLKGKTYSLSRGLNGFAFSPRLVAEETARWGGSITSHWTGARFSGLLIKNLRVARLRARPVNSTVGRHLFIWKLVSHIGDQTAQRCRWLEHSYV